MFIRDIENWEDKPEEYISTVTTRLTLGSFAVQLLCEIETFEIECTQNGVNSFHI